MFTISCDEAEKAGARGGRRKSGQVDDGNNTALLTTGLSLRDRFADDGVCRGESAVAVADDDDVLAEVRVLLHDPAHLLGVVVDALFGNIGAMSGAGEGGDADDVALGMEEIVNVDVVNRTVPGAVHDEDDWLYSREHGDGKEEEQVASVVCELISEQAPWFGDDGNLHKWFV